MEQLRRQVATARRRLVFQQFLTVLPWYWFAALLLAAVGLAIPKIWFLDQDVTIWTTAWLCGSLADGTFGALLWTLVRSWGMVDAAIEFDRRFGLKERISSALTLSPDDRESEAGRALIKDAIDRVEQVRVEDQFGVRVGRPVLLPLVPACLIFILVALADKEQPLSAASDSAALRDRLKKSSADLQEKLAKRRREGNPQEIDEAEALFNKLQKGLDDLAHDDQVNRKDALIKLNDLAKEVQKRRQSLGDSSKMKQQFSRLRKIERGPADKIADALQGGDFQKALEELKQLTDQLKEGELSEEQKQQLAQQLKQMQEKLAEIVETQEQAKRDLERQIQQKIAEGDLESAGKLQRQLDQLEQQDQQMSRLQRMAEQLDKAQDNLESGDAQNAASQLEQMASELSEMQSEMSQLESLDEVMDEIASIKEEMMRGESDMMASFGMNMDQFSDMPGNGMGTGIGEGYRPEEETETGEYDARERAKPQAGEAVRIGDAFGPNRPGMSQEEVKQQILSSLTNDSDPLTDQNLPRSQRDHIKQYFDQVREGQ